IIIIIIGGYFIFNEIKKKQLVNEAQEKAEEYVIDNYEDVESVHVSTDNYDFSTMGTLGIGGNINNEDHLTFYITFLIKGNEVGKVQTVTKPSEFPDKIGN